MATHTLLVFSNPIEGREAEYNRWYDEQHLPDVLKVPGVSAAQRFRLGEGQKGDQRYLAVYELNTNDAAAVTGELAKRAGTDAMPMSDALDTRSLGMTVYEAVSDRVEAG